jgi:serine/threonine-protein kinase HipA
MTEELTVLLDGSVAGRVERDGDRLTFRYEDGWRARHDAYPLSLSMPLARAEHGHAVIEPFLWGLLPDNELVLERWGKRFQVSARSPFRLLAHVGEDCAGAVQLVRPERVEALAAPAASGVEWLDESEVADRLRRLREDHSASRLARDTGQFSLAGAQPKSALLWAAGRWGVPYGATPTTHILKPPVPGLAGHTENERLCLALARALGMRAARSWVHRFGEEDVIVVERFDRLREDASATRIRRVHQEDLCQALGVPPTRKYQNDGGPSVSAISKLLRTHSSRPREDVERLRDAVLFNWLIAGTDAHAKNYSILHAPGGHVRLAPLYDLASVLSFEGFDVRRMKLAMKLGRTYRIADVRRGDIEQLGRDLGLSAEATVERARQLAAALPGAMDQVVGGSTGTLMAQLVDALQARAAECLRWL